MSDTPSMPCRPGWPICPLCPRNPGVPGVPLIPGIPLYPEGPMKPAHQQFNLMFVSMTFISHLFDKNKQTNKKNFCMKDIPGSPGGPCTPGSPMTPPGPRIPCWPGLPLSPGSVTGIAGGPWLPGIPRTPAAEINFVETKIKFVCSWLRQLTNVGQCSLNKRWCIN